MCNQATRATWPTDPMVLEVSGAGKEEHSCIAGGKVEWCNHHAKVGQFLQTLSIESPSDPAVPLPGIYSREMKRHVYSKTCAQTFIAALLVTANKWKQLKNASIDERVNKMHTPTMAYHLA